MFGSGKKRVRFPQMSADAFVSETDQVALMNLQRIPLLPLVMKKFHEHAVDHVLYAYNSSESVRCSPRQYPTLYRILREGCEILDLPEPELYVRYSPQYNAYTAGVQRTFIVLQSSLIDDFTDEELAFVVGHELGHIKCSHVLYQMVGRMLLKLLEVFGRSTLGLGPLAALPLVSAFYEWMRNAEISCDRAGLLVCQNPRAAFTATMKLGAGSTRLDAEMNVDHFLDQARAYSDATGPDALGKLLLFIMYSWYLDHPQVVYRAKALDEWIRGGAYEKILNGNYARRPASADDVRCPHCLRTVSPGVPFCAGCGTDLRESGAGGQPCARCGEEIPRGIRFCVTCGTPAGETGEAEEPV